MYQIPGDWRDEAALKEMRATWEANRRATRWVAAVFYAVLGTLLAALALVLLLR